MECYANQQVEIMKKKNILVVPLLIATCIFSGPVLADENDEHDENGRKAKTFIVEGEVRTGFNSSKGRPIYDLGGVLGGLNWNFVFVHEPNGSESSPITVDTDENRLLATGVDPFFYGVIVGFDTSLINHDALNVPFRNIPIIVDDITGARSPLEPISSDNFKERRGLSSPADPITIADWFRAEGIARVKCWSSEKARVVFRFENLVPNGIYTVWGLYGTDANNDGIRDGLTPPIAFGGVPNAFTADEKGDASFKRTLPFCPTTDKDMLLVQVAYHVDSATFGGAPAMYPTVSNTFLGNVPLAPQMSFNFGGLKRLN